VAVCDVDSNHAEAFRARYGGKPEMYRDYHKLLDRKDFGAAVIATPNRWHTATWATSCYC
jgi:predicted dehydrogenase